MKDILTFIVELMKAVAWPLVTLLLLWHSRVSFSLLIQKIKKAKFMGGEADFNTDIQSLENGPPILGSEGIVKPDDKGMHNSKYIITYDNFGVVANREEIATKLVDGMSDAEKIKSLTNLVAVENMKSSYSWIYIFIYGSQIAFLDYLNRQYTYTGIYHGAAKSYYEAYVEKIPEMKAVSNFDGWIGFLLTQGLIIDDSGLYKISDYGKGFLVYMTVSNLPSMKIM
ncbi:TPA: hypothetical protein U5D21_002990 [Yersinia enterocolitica]|nr:hypothetical protein [Yersinia enterocolitica]